MDLPFKVKTPYSILEHSLLPAAAGSYFFTSQFLEITTWLWFGNSSGNFLIYTMHANDLSCKLIMTLWIAADSMAGYTIVCLGVERLIAITWPFRAKTILTPRFSATLLALVNGSVVGVGTFTSLLNYGLSDNELFSEKICTYTTEHVGETLSQLFVWVESCMTAGHTAIALVISVVLVFKLHVATMHRRRMSISVDRLTAKEVSYALILVSIASIHCAIYAPLSGFAIWYHSTNKTPHDAVDCGYSVGFPFLILDLLINLTLVTHSVNFFVYLFRSRHFRSALLCCARRRWRALGDSTGNQHSVTARLSFNAAANSALVAPTSKHLLLLKTSSATLPSKSSSSATASPTCTSTNAHAHVELSTQMSEI